MGATRFDLVLMGLVGLVIGFLGATLVFYSELRHARRRADSFEKMNDRHNARILLCKTGALQTSVKFIWRTAARNE